MLFNYAGLGRGWRFGVRGFQRGLKPLGMILPPPPSLKPSVQYCWDIRGFSGGSLRSLGTILQWHTGVSRSLLKPLGTILPAYTRGFRGALISLGIILQWYRGVSGGPLKALGTILPGDTGVSGGPWISQYNIARICPFVFQINRHVIF